MITKEMKELYATGEWILIRHYIPIDEWEIAEEYIDGFPYKLIHEKHADALSHVLSGGEALKDDTSIQKVDDFITHYNIKCNYDILLDIKDNPTIGKSPQVETLDGHYCLATKEHYDKLVEDGYRENDLFREHLLPSEIFCIEDGIAQLFDIGFEEGLTPMHLHNNEWKFGSLEYEDVPASYLNDPVWNETEGEKYARLFNDMSQLEPKPDERIARIEFKKDLLKRAREQNGELGTDVSLLSIHHTIDKVFDYIEFLEANQKDK